MTASVPCMDAGDYRAYVLREWALFAGDPARRTAAARAAESVRVARVLDVGCGGAQELLPFLGGSGVLGVGIDLSPDVGFTAGRMTEHLRGGSRAVFARARAESLPFESGCFDLVICRLVLPYANNSMLLAEIGRVLRPGGVLLLKYHHLRYYLERLSASLAAGHWRGARHAMVVLAGGAVFHASGRQGAHRLTSEVFQTDRTLRAALAACGLEMVSDLPDANPSTPAHLIRRAGASPQRARPQAWSARGAIGKAVRKLVRTLVYARDEVLVFVDAREPGPAGPEPRERPVKVELRTGSYEDLAEAAAAYPEYLDESRLARAKERLARGDRAYVVRCGGRIAHVNWAGVRDALVATEVGTDVRIRLEPEAVVAYDAWTAPEFRSLGLFTDSLGMIRCDAARMALRCWCYCRAENRASRRVIEKNGFRLTHRLVRVRVAGLSWSRASDASGEA